MATPRFIVLQSERSPMPALADPVTLGGLDLPNRLYRAPLLECAGTGPDTAERLADELEPTAASGVGLIFQGASIVRAESGCAAPNMTRVHDDAFVAGLSPVPEAIEAHGGRLFCQLAHGGLRSLPVWHAEAREAGHEELAVSRPPRALRLLDRAGLLDLNPQVMTTAEVEALAADFGRAAARVVEAGYHGIHIAGANMGIVQQFLSPYYNRRHDRFADGVRFLELVHDEIRARAGDVPLVTKVPAETAAPRFVRSHLTAADAVDICERLADVGYDAVAPVACSVFWDMSLIRGAFPKRAWESADLQSGYEAAFGSRWRARLVQALNRVQARRFSREGAWNAALCRRVRERVDVPVLCEGGVRERATADRLLGDACDLVGMGRPFYAEPRLGARLLDGGGRALCRDCNNCTVPQVTGARGECRTPAVVRERGRRERAGEYDGR